MLSNPAHAQVQMQVPRISYLPLLIPEIRKNLLDLVLDDNESALLREDQLWLDCEGEPLRWSVAFVPILAHKPR